MKSLKLYTELPLIKQIPGKFPGILKHVPNLNLFHSFKNLGRSIN